MRHFKLKLRIIWALITDNYVNSDRENSWWLIGGKSEEDRVRIVFGYKWYLKSK